MFAYPDAARYRLGVNYQHLPCNRPVCPVYNPYQRDGFMNATENYGADPNYVRSSLKPIKFEGTVGANGNAAGGHQQWVAGAISSYTSELTDDDFAQPRAFWNLLAKQEGQQEHLVNNVAGHLGSADPIMHKDALGTLIFLLITDLSC
ncbi:putative catalase protein [Ilyonectria robusta]